MGNPTHEAQNYSHAASRDCSQKFAALLTTPGDGCVVADVRNKMQIGDAVEVISPTTIFNATIQGIQTIKGESVMEAHGGAGLYKLDLGVPVENNSLLSIKYGPLS
jgi:hypothetical protein